MDDYAALMAKARKRVAAMDKHDGGSEVDRFGCSQALRTIIAALYSGMNRGDWDTVADAMVMVQQVELKYRPADEQTKGAYDPGR